MFLQKQNVLNTWFVGILWLKIVFTSLSLITTVTKQINNDPNWVFFVGIFLTLGAIIGAYMLTKAYKIGFYLVVLTNLASAVISYIICPDFMFVWPNLAQIALLLLLMLLKHDGKNVYQVLWGKQ